MTMSAALDLLKFLLGAVILIIALLDSDPQPVIAVIALLLMGVVTIDQIREWMNRHRVREETP
jgi:uncharacterized membrane protein (DUF441 family)